MSNYFRLRTIEVENFMAIAHGKISVPSYYDINTDAPSYIPSEILGVYGMNGTGKSSLVNALMMLRAVYDSEMERVMRKADFGEQRALHKIDKNTFKLMIRKGADLAAFIYTFDICTERKYLKVGEVTISFSIKATEEGFEVFNEKVVINTDTFNVVIKTGQDLSTYVMNNSFIPLLSNEYADIHKSKVLKDLKSYKLKAKEGVSVICQFIKHYHNNFENSETSEILWDFLKYVSAKICIVGDYDFGRVRSANYHYRFVLNWPSPIYNKVDEKMQLPNAEPDDRFRFFLDLKTGKIALANDIYLHPVAEDAVYEALNYYMGRLGYIIGEFIKGLSFTVTMGTPVTNEVTIINPKDRKSFKSRFTESEYRLWSVRDGKMIPFGQESYGIKKLLLIVLNLVSVMNDPSFTLVVDEMDEGLFEYLLGDVLTSLREDGHGQLIFTAHNLIPLERLDKKSIWFTSNDVNKRFERIGDLKRENNLRDIYFKEISGTRLSSRDSLFYGVSKGSIVEALKEAAKY